MALFPHERSLVKKYSDQPFAILGVNSDTDKKRLPDRLERYDINWRSFWNGPKGPRGPIAKDWNIPTWPYSYLLDADGVIRYRNLTGKDLEVAIEKLLEEAANG